MECENCGSKQNPEPICENCQRMQRGESFLAYTSYKPQSGIGRGSIQTWPGKTLGAYRVINRWRVPNGWMSGWMWAIEATIDGRRYHGRTSGDGFAVMLYPYKHQ